MSTVAEPIVQVAGLQMSYGSVPVLTGVDFSIATGEVVALLGPNGAGKTTTIEILEGFRVASGGEVRVLGQEPATADEQWRARIGVVLQSWRDHAKWRVRELLAHLGEFYRPYGRPGRPRPLDVDQLLARVGLEDKGQRQILRLSGGERRRLDVAVGLIGNPELLFLDEPTAGFDPVARRDFHDLLRALADDEVSILLTTHDLDEAERVADRILLLAGGSILAEGTPDALRLQVRADAEVRWTRDGHTHVHATTDPAAFLKPLLNAPGGPVTDLEVRRASLEDAYVGLVHRYEMGLGGDVESVHGGRALPLWTDARRPSPNQAPDQAPDQTPQERS
ncbi:MAG: ABC transporter ATP-binding protein [Austwickia sp.]|jgi:ABC-2 type transport system ATP-binding protein|nr:ABC transporter ATP-binding protein [Austwickia sp.]MBK8436037.1 ABC transporter ATP-binding protein [Austwickia sp.]MBK9101717.1 ABC transporter ATP-binding protein [Austwickia sp.]